MSELARLYGIIVSVFFRDVGRHNTPHVHVTYAGDEASVAIADGALLSGTAPRLVLRIVREWLRRHKPQVEAAWEAARNGQSVKKIGAGRQPGRKRASKKESS